MKKYIQRKQISTFFTWLNQNIKTNNPIKCVQFIGNPGLGKSVLLEMISNQIIENHSNKLITFSVQHSSLPIASLKDISKQIINNHSLTLLNQNQLDVLNWIENIDEKIEIPYKQTQIANAIVNGLHEGVSTQKCILIMLDDFDEYSQFEQNIWQMISTNECKIPIVLVIACNKKVWRKKCRTFFVKPFTKQQTFKYLDNYFATGWSKHSPDLSQYLFEFTNGAPLFLNFLINELNDEGKLTNIKSSSMSEIKLPNIPRTFSELFISQLKDFSISKNNRQNLELLAMSELLIPQNSLSKILDITIPQFELFLNELLRKDWVCIYNFDKSKFLKFTHPLLKEIIFSKIPMNRKKDIHHKLYEWCKQNNQSNIETLKHFRYAGLNPKDNLELFKETSLIHKKIGDFELAIQIIDELLLYVKNIDKQHWLIEKADIQFSANNIGKTKDILKEINFNKLSNDKQIRYLSISASIDSLSGNPNQAILKLEQSLKIKTEKPVYHWNAMAQLINYYRLINKLDNALKLGENLLKMPIDDFTRVQTISSITIILRIYNPEKLDINSILKDGMEICDLNGFDNIHSILCNTMGHLFWQTSSYPEALEFYEKSLRFARSGAYAVMEDIAMQGIAMIYSCMGNVSGSIKINLEREKLLIKQKNENSLLLCRNSLMTSYLTIGYLKKAEHYFELTRDSALKQNNISVLLYALNAGWLIQFHLGMTFDFSIVEKLKKDELEESLAPHKYQLSLLETKINFYQNGKQEDSYKEFQIGIQSLTASEKLPALWQLGIMQIFCDDFVGLKKTIKQIKIINSSTDRDTILNYFELVISSLYGNKTTTDKLQKLLRNPIDSIDVQFCWVLLWLLKNEIIPQNMLRETEEFVQCSLKIAGVKRVPEGFQVPKLSELESPIGKLFNSVIKAIKSKDKVEISDKVFNHRYLETFAELIRNWGINVNILNNEKPPSNILTIKLLGKPQIFIGNKNILKGSWEINKMAQLLLILILKGWHNKGMVEADSINDEIWQKNGERQDPNKLRNKRKTMIFRLRKILSHNNEENFILQEDGWYGINWNSPYLNLDLLKFKSAFLMGMNPENENRLFALEKCIELYQGSLVESLDLPWIDPLRWEFEDMQGKALKSWIKLMEPKNPNLVENRLQTLFNAYPDSAFYADLLNRHYQKQGMQAMADEVYRRHKKALA